MESLNKTVYIKSPRYYDPRFNEIEQKLESFGFKRSTFGTEQLETMMLMSTVCWCVLVEDRAKKHYVRCSDSSKMSANPIDLVTNDLLDIVKAYEDENDSNLYNDYF